MKSALRPLALSILVLASVLAGPARATTYQMMPDAALVDQAAAVVEAKVVGVDNAPVITGPPSTDYLVEINKVLKGDLPGSTLVVRVPGGVNPEGLGLKIWGAPQFAEGEDALLFLAPAKDGTYRILHLMLGAFHKRVVGGREVALRDLSEAHEVGKGLELGGADAVRDFSRFSGWLADRAEGLQPKADYVIGSQAKAQLQKAAAADSVADKFTLLIPDDGNAIRWFKFDAGQSVQWRVHQAGQPGLSVQATIDAFKVALNTWTSDPSTNINYVYAGTTSAGGGLARSDDVNTILFDDPYRDDPENAVEGTFDCSSGGVIAMGGPFFFTSTKVYKGVRYHEAAEADIVTNDGTDCFFNNNPSAAEEVFTHELGHTLGLGHSRTRNSIMWANAHNDGRGARLDDDDRAAIASLYGTTGGSTGGGKLTAPAKLVARAAGGGTVNLTWRDKAKGEDGYRVEVKVGSKGAFREILQLDANASSASVTDLTPGTSYTFRVRAANGDTFSGYSNAATVKAN